MFLCGAAALASPGGKLSSEARLKRNAGGNLTVSNAYQTYEQVCFCSKTFGLSPEFLFRPLRGHLPPGGRFAATPLYITITVRPFTVIRSSQKARTA